ncbi:MAG: NrfD/PsrC family molybdoenzyme membrane anchor subunit, partial [Gemmatimonadales bacterium]
MAVIVHDPSMPTQTHAEVTRDVVRTITEKPTRGYYILAGTMAFLVLVLFGTLGALLKYGLGLAGYAPPIMWSVYITTFVFWIGIGHAGTLISAILYLFRSRWRTAVY